MAAQAFLLIASFLVVLFVLARPLGSGLARLINNVPLPGTGSVEKGIWRVLGIDDREMNWRDYLIAILLLNIVGLIALFAMLMFQGVLPLNPQQLPGLSWHLALNTAVSFVTNTNWQSYAGETTLSYFSQMVGLTVQNFLSAASGIAVIFALTRAFARQKVSTLGNAWVDLTRITLWILLPIALLIALFFIQQGSLQNCCLTHLIPRWKAQNSSCRWGQWRRRKPSKCSGRTAAASSMPTRRTRSKTRPP